MLQGYRGHALASPLSREARIPWQQGFQDGLRKGRLRRMQRPRQMPGLRAPCRSRQGSQQLPPPRSRQTPQVWSSSRSSQSLELAGQPLVTLRQTLLPQQTGKLLHSSQKAALSGREMLLPQQGDRLLYGSHRAVPSGWQQRRRLICLRTLLGSSSAPQMACPAARALWCRLHRGSLSQSVSHRLSLWRMAQTWPGSSWTSRLLLRVSLLRWTQVRPDCLTC